MGGQDYLCLGSATSAGGGCDSAHQTIPPVSALGAEYAAAPYKTRRASGDPESIPYRIVGAVDGTTLEYDPPVEGAPAGLSVGQRVDFEATGPFVVRSQDKEHPYYLGQMMTGCHVKGGSVGDCDGDEEWVTLFPPAQYLSKYVFFTDPTYPTTNLVVVRAAVSGAFKDVDLDCTGTIREWTPFGSGQYEMAYVDIVRGGVPNGACRNGPHLAQSEGPFGVVVWGLDHAASYAYQAGGNIAPINTVTVNPVP